MRKFIDKGHYFILLQESGWAERFETGTDRLLERRHLGWRKTHIVVTRSSMKKDDGADYGMQLLRFYGKTEEGPWDLASNPYAGVYLTPAEWFQIFKRCGIEVERP